MGIDYESLAKLTQEFIANRPVIILGSGASIPHGLPSMSGLARQLLEKIDINDDKWRRFETKLKGTKDLEKALQNTELSSLRLERVVNETWAIANKQDLQAYGNLLNKKDNFPLIDLFKYLLRTANPKISVVTTNYDRLAEYSANIAKAEVFTGFTSGWIQRFEPDILLRNASSNSIYNGQINILKVHGSLDWFGIEGEESIAIPLAREIPENRVPLIVTPGMSKYRATHKDPFRTIIAQSDVVLKKASCFLCIGFGFNDEHIQPILVDRVRTDNIPVIIVTKKLSGAVKAAFLETPPKKFIILEEAEKNGTMVYCENQPAGEVLNDYRLWELPNFLDMLLVNKDKI